MLVTDYKLFRAISLCVAHKTDMRAALRGMLFEPRLGRVTASNGHRLMSGQAVEEENLEPFIWTTQNKLPKSKSPLALFDPASGILSAGDRRVVGKIGPTDGFPQYERFIAPEKGDLRISFDARLLADVQEALKAETCLLVAQDDSSPIHVRFFGKEGLSFTLMPSRWYQ